MATLRLSGAKELKKIMDALGPTISKRAGVTGVRKGAIVMRRELKAASPNVTGRLAKQWRYRKLRAPRNSDSVAYVVNLRGYYFYETLEFNSKLGAPRHPFAETAMMAAKAQAFAAIVDGTRTALAQEAGKAYARSLRLRSK